MADLTFEDMFDGAPAPKPASQRPTGTSWQITPEVQAERDRAAGVLLRSEYGGEKGLRNQIKLIDKEMKVANPDYKGILADQRKLHVAGLSAPDAQSQELSFGDMFEGGVQSTPSEPPPRNSIKNPRSDASIALGGVGAGALAVANEAAVMADMFISNLPGAVVGVAGAELERLRQTLKGAPRSEVAKAAYSEQVRLTEKFSPNLFKKFVGLFAPEGEEPKPGVTEKAMNYLMELSDRDAASLEERTGGAVKKEEVQSLRDSFLTFFGVHALKGSVKAGTKAIVDRAGKSGEKKTFAVDEVPPDAPPPAAPSVIETPTGRVYNLDPKPVSLNPTVRALTSREEYSLAVREEAKAMQKREDVETAVSEDPAWADQLEAMAEEQARTRELRRIEQERLAISEAAPRTRPMERVEAQDRPQNLETQLRPFQNIRLAQTPPLDSGLQKIAKGQAFTLTAEELAAVRSSRSVWNRPEVLKGQIDTDLLAAIALGTTGAALAYMYPDETQSAFNLAAAGALVTPGRGRLTVDDIKAMPEGRSLGSILKESPITFKTLEMPELQNRVDIPVSMIEQALKREGMTKAERDVFHRALAMSPGKTISAKELMLNLKYATGDWELRPKDTESYANYGLESIDRKTSNGEWGPDVPDVETLRDHIAAAEERLTDVEIEHRAVAPEGTAFQDYPYTPQQARIILRRAETDLREAREQLAIREQLDAKVVEPVPDSTTTIWELPSHMTLSDNNHFGDPRYFGHTRAFQEDGTRHVVEIQSDLAQKLDKPPAPEEIDRIARAADLVKRQRDIITSAMLDRRHGYFAKGTDFQKLADELLTINEDAVLRLGSTLQRFDDFKNLDAETAFNKAVENAKEADVYEFRHRALENAFTEFKLNLDELEAKHATALNSAAVHSQIGPTLKDWHKRLIREELASAAMKVGGIKNYIDNRERAAQQALREIEEGAGMPDELREELQKYADSEIADALHAKSRLDKASIVRFATADTVAKVEGWQKLPDERGPAPSLAEFANYADFQQALREYNALSTSNGPRFFPEHQGIYDRYRRDVEKFLGQLGGKPYTDSKGHTWIEVPVDPSPKGRRAQMFGKADDKLLKLLAAGTVGTVIGANLSDDKTIGPAVGLLLGGFGAYTHSKYPAVREYAKDSIARADYFTGLVSTRLWNESPALHRRALDFELASLANGHRDLTEVHTFVKRVGKLKGDARSAFKRAALTNDPAVITRTLEQIGDPELTAGWNSVRKILDQKGKDMVDAGLLKNLRDSYFPRAVKDKAGLFEKLGKEERTFLEQRLKRAEEASIKKNGHGLTELESAAIINEYLSTTAPIGSRPGFLKKRTIGEVTKELEPFYEDPGETLVSYIRASSREIEKAKFFGKYLRRMEVDGKSMVDMDASIGALTDDLLKKGELTPEGVDEVRSILNSRFGPGEASSYGLVQDFRNAAYTGLLGNAISAAVQLSDVGVNVALRGLLPTMEAVGRKLTGTQKISVRDMGLLDHVAEEFAGQRPSAKMLRLVFKGAGFTHLDAFSKDVAVNSALIHRTNQLKSAKGEARFDADLARAYDDDLPQLKADLRAGKRTDLTNSLAFAELSRTQPISRLEVPQAYLDNPNGRTFYMLKTYSLKQADLIRRDAYNNIKAGRPREGFTKLARIGTAFMLAGATSQWVSDWMSGRGFDPSWEDLPAGFFKTFGLSSYVGDMLAERGPAAAAGSIVMPPVKMIDDIYQGKDKAIRYIPFGGRLAYEHNFGGAESFKAREVLKRREAERNAGLSDDEKKQRAERLKQRAEARRRRLAEDY